MNLKPYITISLHRERGITYEVRLDVYDDCGEQTYITLSVLESEKDVARFLHYLSGGSSNE